MQGGGGLRGRGAVWYAAQIRMFNKGAINYKENREKPR